MADNIPDFGRLDEVASRCLAARVRILNRVVTTIFDRALRPVGLRVSQGNILVVVGRLGRARPAEVCRLLRLEKSTLSRDVEVMKARGWLESDPPGGGRNQALRITDAGLSLLERARPAWEAAQEEAARLIGGPGVEAIREVVARLALAVDPD